MLKHGMIALALLVLISCGSAKAEEGEISQQTLPRLGLGGLQLAQDTPVQPARETLPNPPAHVAAVQPPIFGQRQLFILNHQRDNLKRTALRIANRAWRF